MTLQGVRLMNRILGRVPRGWPVPVMRPEGYSIAGEQWCGYVPPEPMTHRQAEEVRVIRDRAAHDDGWRQLVEGQRNRRAAEMRREQAGRALVRPSQETT